MSQRGLAPIIIILLIALGIGGYLVYSGQINLNQNQQKSNTSQQPTNQVKPVAYSNNTFQNINYLKQQLDTSGAILNLLYPKSDYPSVKDWDMNYPNEMKLDDTQLVGMRCTKYITPDSTNGLSTTNLNLLHNLNLNTKNLPNFKDVKAGDFFSFEYCETEDNKKLFFYTSGTSPQGRIIHIAITSSQDHPLTEITSSSTKLYDNFGNIITPVELTKSGILYVQYEGGDSAYGSSIYKFDINNPTNTKEIISCFSTPIDAGHCKIL